MCTIVYHIVYYNTYIIHTGTQKSSPFEFMRLAWKLEQTFA